MLQSPLLKSNPQLYVFLPIFYTVWSDAVLTPSEIQQIQTLIDGQSWLSAEERKFLLEQLNPAAPPTPNEFKAWQEEINKIASELEAGQRESLVDIGMRLVRKNSLGTISDTLVKAKSALQKVEETLGVISNEASYFVSSASHPTETEKLGTQSTFDINTLAALLDGSQAEIIRKVKTIISDPTFEFTDVDNRIAYREKILEWCKHLAAQGYGAMAYPKAFGGRDDMESYFTIMEVLSYRDLSMVIKYGVQFGLFGMSVQLLGTEKHHKKYLEAIGKLELPGCFGMTESGHGSNVKGIETTATYDHAKKTFTIHTPHKYARKDYIGNAARHGQMATVFAKLIVEEKDYGVAALLVPIRNTEGKTLPGITIEDCGRKMGLNGVDNGRITFDQVEVPKDNLLNRFADVDEHGKFTSSISSDNRRFFTMLGTLVGGRIGIPRSGLSASKKGLTIAIRYGDRRKQFGPEGASEVPILNYRTHQRRLMPLLANAYGLHFALQYLTQRFLNKKEDEMQEIEALAAGLKSFATWNATHTLQECREACGGNGYLSNNQIDSLKNDTDIYTTFEGDNTVLMQLVAKGRLTQFRQEFGSMNLFGILNYVADQAKTSLTEMNPFIVRNTDVEHLLDPEFQLNAFEYRERDILTSAARRLKRHIDDGMDSFDAFNVCQHHLVEVGLAYVERVIFEEFRKQIDRTKDKGCKAILTKLCNLYTLSRFDKNKGWYLEQGYMEGPKTKAIRKLFNQLCWEVRQDAVPLVDAFKIPDACLKNTVGLEQS